MRRVLAVVLCCLLATLVLAAAGPAAADGSVRGGQPNIGLSRDGIHFRADLELSLFDSPSRWVPGDVRSSSFWVRNQAGEPGDLTIDLVSDRSGELFDSGFLDVAARTGDGPWRSVRSGESMRLVSQRGVPAEAAVPVSVRVTLDPEADDATMDLAAELDFDVTMTDSRASAAGGGDHGPGGLLPDTGAATGRWVLPLGLVLLLAGGVALRSHAPASTRPTGRPHEGDRP